MYEVSVRFRDPALFRGSIERRFDRPDARLPRIVFGGPAEAFDADARLLLGSVLAEQGERSESIAQLSEGVRLRPQSAEAHYQLARVYVRLRKTEDAQRELAAFKQLSDAQKEKRETDRRELLRRLANVRF